MLKHLALIPDGDRRWARARNLPEYKGHEKMAEVIVDLANHCWDIGITIFTIHLFSTENWKRSDEEVKKLLEIINDLISNLEGLAKEHNVKMVHMGRKDRIPKKLAKTIKDAESFTQLNTKHTLNFCIDYGGQDEIIRAIKKAVEAQIPLNDLTPEKFETFLDNGAETFISPDLLIRFSGEIRLSGFMSWQNAYSELYFHTDYFPDFNSEKLDHVLLEFDKRNRRFGGR